MTQPAKVTEPSMEEILASIRRIIADDEAKPAAAEKSAAPAAAKPAAPPAKAPVMNDIPPSTIAPPKPAAVKPAPTPPPAEPAPAPAATASNSQDDIDAMLAGLDEATSEAEIRPAQPVPEPEADVFELTDAMAVAEPEPFGGEARHLVHRGFQLHEPLLAHRTPEHPRKRSPEPRVGYAEAGESVGPDHGRWICQDGLDVGLRLAEIDGSARHQFFRRLPL